MSSVGAALHVSVHVGWISGWGGCWSRESCCDTCLFVYWCVHTYLPSLHTYLYDTCLWWLWLLLVWLLLLLVACLAVEDMGVVPFGLTLLLHAGKWW